MLMSCAQDQDILPSKKSDSDKAKNSKDTAESQVGNITPSSQIFSEDAIVIEFYQRLAVISDQETQQNEESSSDSFNESDDVSESYFCSSES